MLINIQLCQCTDIDLEFIFISADSCVKLRIQAVNSFDHQNILLSKLHIMSVYIPVCPVSKLNVGSTTSFSCKQLFQIAD